MIRAVFTLHHDTHFPSSSTSFPDVNLDSFPGAVLPSGWSGCRTLADAHLLQESHRRTLVREGRLEKVESDERCKEKRVGMDEVSQKQSDEDERSGGHSKVAFNCHYAPPLVSSHPLACK